MTLRWERGETGAWHGHSGALVVAFVVKRFDGQWAWAVDEVRRPYGWKSSGVRKSAAGGRYACDRYWRRWLDRVQLQPIATGEDHDL